MNEFWALFKTLLINSVGLSVIWSDKAGRRKKLLKILGLGLLIVVGFAPAIYLYTRLLIQGYDLLAPLGQQGAIISLGLTVAAGMVFFFGVFYVISTFYFTDYMQNLLALPLAPWQLLGAQFSLVVVYEYLSTLPFVLPPLLVYGVKAQVSPLFWIYALASFFLIPLFPLSLAALPTVIIMRFSNIGRHRDWLKIAGGVLIIVIAVGIQIPLQRGLDPGAIQEILTRPGGLMEWTGRMFPSNLWLARALVYSDTLTGLGYWLIYVLISVAAVAATWVVGDRVYLAGLAGSGESMPGKTGKRTLTGGKYTLRSTFFAYFFKEVRLLLRTPPYFINCVLTNFLGPFILIIIPLLQPQQTSNLTLIAQHPRSPIIIMLASLGLVAFLAASNAITGTTFSREGRQLFVSRYIPIDFINLALAKIASGLLFGGTGALFVAGIVLWLFKIPPVEGLGLFFLSLLVQLPILMTGLLIDLYNPKLEWENEQGAVKRNMNVLYSMIAGLVLLGPVLWGAYHLDSLYAAGLVLAGAVIIESVLLFMAIRGPGQERFYRLEA